MVSIAAAGAPCTTAHGPRGASADEDVVHPDAGKQLDWARL